MQWVEFPYSVNLKTLLHHLFGLSWEMQTWERWSMQLRLWESWKKDHLLLLSPSQQATLTLFCSLRLWLRNMEIWLSDLLFLGVQLSTSQWKRPSRFFKESLLWSGMSWWSWTLSISQPSSKRHKSCFSHISESATTTKLSGDCTRHSWLSDFQTWVRYGKSLDHADGSWASIDLRRKSPRVREWVWNRRAWKDERHHRRKNSNWFFKQWWDWDSRIQKDLGSRTFWKNVLASYWVEELNCQSPRRGCQVGEKNSRDAIYIIWVHVWRASRLANH